MMTPEHAKLLDLFVQLLRNKQEQDRLYKEWQDRQHALNKEEERLRKEASDLVGEQKK
jgi:hypothetical protein